MSIVSKLLDRTLPNNILYMVYGNDVTFFGIFSVIIIYLIKFAYFGHI